MEINSIWLWAHLWHATAEVEEDEEDDGMRSARLDGMASEGSVEDSKGTFLSSISILDI